LGKIIIFDDHLHRNAAINYWCYSNCWAICSRHRQCTGSRTRRSRKIE